MLILTLGEGDFWATPSNAGPLASFCADLLRSRSLAGCLASLPEEPAARRRLFTFLRSLQRAGGGQTVIALPGDRVTPDSLRACEVGQVDHVVILQGTDDPADAIASVLRFRDTHPVPQLGIHVWVDAGLPGSIHRTAAAWTRAFGAGIAVELAPAVLASIADARTTATSSGGDRTTRELAGPAPASVACEWLRSTVTIHPSGTVVPCPHHAPNGHPPITSAPATLVAAVATFPQTLASDATCRGCARRMRFTIPDWMKSRHVAPRTGGASPLAAEERFVDHVEGRLDDVELAMRATLIEAFIERARSVATAP